MAFLSYTFTQPYFKYVENWEYDVIPGTITLTFDSTPSSEPSDYYMSTSGGIIMYQERVGFSTYDQTLVFDGNNVTLTVPINMDTNIYMQFYYQGNPLPFRIRADQDTTYETPAIFVGLPFTAS